MKKLCLRAHILKRNTFFEMEVSIHRLVYHSLLGVLHGECVSKHFVYLFRDKGQVILHSVKDAVLLLHVLGVLMRKRG